MVKRSHGDYSKRSRRLRSKGLTSINTHLLSFENGDRVAIDINPRFRAGRPATKFNHRIGEVVSRQGRAFKVRVSDLGKNKILLVSNPHLKKM